jgi:crotonobetainyl-CoA:carnitine CoA-transferase CaiB-like acyl-CoA transferase
VLKVEDTGMGDYVRWSPPYYEGVEDARSRRCSSRSTATSARSGSTSRRGGREVLLRAGARRDVVLESFRPGVLDRLGVGYEALRGGNPRIVYCAITGYGQDGPTRDRSGPRHELPRARSGCSG